MSPSSTLSPTATSIFHTLPVMCASMSAMERDNIRACADSPRRPRRGAQRGRPGRRHGQGARAAPSPARRSGSPTTPPSDDTEEVAMAAGAQVVSRGRPHGKGANVTAAAEAALSASAPRRSSCSATATSAPPPPRLAPLVDAVERGECDLAVAAFSRRVGGGFGLALGFARWAIRRRCGLETTARSRASGRCAADVLRATLPFAARLRDGGRDDHRRGPRRLSRAASTSSTSRTAPPAAPSPASPTAASSCATSPGLRITARVGRPLPAAGRTLDRAGQFEQRRLAVFGPEQLGADRQAGRRSARRGR